MRPSFHPRLINPPFSDPGVFVPFAFQKHAILFDVGDLTPLSSRELLNVSHVFISHAHMDHVIGFDHLVRLNLGRRKRLHVYGPSGILAHIRGRLAGYTWNLVDRYAGDFHITVDEISETCRLRQDLACRNGFQPDRAPIQWPADRTLATHRTFRVTCDILDHDTPCLGFRLEEPFHVNVIPEALHTMGLAVGPWVSRLKQMLLNRDSGDTVLDAVDAHGQKHRVTLGEVSERAVRISEGQVAAYITDAAGHESNIRRIRRLADSADDLFIEAMFLEADRDMAIAKHHLTAARAGTIAGVSGVRQYHLFHFSPRYTDTADEIYAEAREAFVRSSRQ